MKGEMNNMEKFEQYLVRTRHTERNGIQKLYRFENGYGASVIRSYYSYGGNKGLWELAMIKWIDDFDYNIYYCDIVDDDVLGYLAEKDIVPILEKIKNYKFQEALCVA